MSKQDSLVRTRTIFMNIITNNIILEKWKSKEKNCLFNNINSSIIIKYHKTRIFTTCKSGCNNADFEYGNFTNWVGYTGSCCPVVMTSNGLNTVGPPGDTYPQQMITGPLTPGTDPNSCNQITYVDNLPGGGVYSCRLGNSEINCHAERLEYSLVVSLANANFIMNMQLYWMTPGMLRLTSQDSKLPLWILPVIN